MNKRIFIILALLLSNVSFAKPPWVLNKQSDGIKVYVRDISGYSTKSFKAEVTVRASLTALVALIDDTKIYPQFFHQCKSAQNIKEVGHNQSYKYIITKMPWPVKDRDIIIHSVISQHKQTKQVEIKMKASSALIPLKKDRVRIKKMSGRWLLIPEKKGMTKVIYETTIDPGGKLPKWLVNAMSTDIPFNTLKNLRSLIKKSLYQSANNSFIVNEERLYW